MGSTIFNCCINRKNHETLRNEENQNSNSNENYFIQNKFNNCSNTIVNTKKKFSILSEFKKSEKNYNNYNKNSKKKNLDCNLNLDIERSPGSKKTNFTSSNTNISSFNSQENIINNENNSRKNSLKKSNFDGINYTNNYYKINNSNFGKINIFDRKINKNYLNDINNIDELIDEEMSYNCKKERSNCLKKKKEGYRKNRKNIL